MLNKTNKQKPKGDKLSLYDEGVEAAYKIKQANGNHKPLINCET